MDDLIPIGIDATEATLSAIAKRFAKHSVVKWFRLFSQNVILLIFAGFFWAGVTFSMSVGEQEPVKILPLPQSNTVAIVCFAAWVTAMFPWATTRVLGFIGKKLFVPAIDGVGRLYKQDFSIEKWIAIRTKERDEDSDSNDSDSAQ